MDATKKCKKCKKDIPDESLYCLYCGAPQQRNKKKRMYQRPDGLFEQIKTINGKRVAFRGKTEKEVLDKMIAYRAEDAAGPLFSEVAEQWWEEISEDLAYNTVKGYKAKYDHAVERFGDSRIKQLSPADVRAYLKYLAARGYAYKTVAHHLSVMRLICDYAIANDILLFNPTSGATVPRKLPRNHRDVPADTDLALIQENAASGLQGLLAAFCLYTGCRASEAYAVRMKDIDRKAKTLSISSAFYYVHNQPQLKDPKTSAGIRVVPLPDFLLDLIKPGKTSDFVFSLDGGKTPLTESQSRKGWAKYRKETGINCTLHQLRHAYATLLFEAGVDIKTAQNMMGHADISTTMKIYTHIREQHLTVSRDIFRNFLQAA